MRETLLMHAPALRLGGQLRESTSSACASLKLPYQKARDGARPYVVKKWGAFFIFQPKTIAKKTIQMKSSESIFCKKWAFSGSWRKKFFLWRRAWSRGVGVRGVLARRGVGVRGVLARRSGRVWMDVPGRAWMEAMEVVHV